MSHHKEPCNLSGEVQLEYLGNACGSLHIQGDKYRQQCMVTSACFCGSKTISTRPKRLGLLECGPLLIGFKTRSPSSALLPFSGRFGSPSKIDYRQKKRHPYSKLSSLEDLEKEAKRKPRSHFSGGLSPCHVGKGNPFSRRQ